MQMTKMKKKVHLLQPLQIEPREYTDCYNFVYKTVIIMINCKRVSIESTENAKTIVESFLFVDKYTS